MTHKESGATLQPSAQGNKLRQCALAGKWDTFFQTFFQALHTWAEEEGFTAPTHLQPHVSKSLISAGQVGGAPDGASINRLYARVRRELNCDLVHPSPQGATLGQMACFYYQQIRKHSAH